MYGNSIQSPFMMSNMTYGPTMLNNSMMRSIPMMHSTPNMLGMQTSRNGLSTLLGLGRAGNTTGGLFSGLRTLNFGNLLTNT